MEQCDDHIKVMIKIKPTNQEVQVMKLSIDKDVKSNNTIHSKNKLFCSNLPSEEGMKNSFFLA